MRIENSVAAGRICLYCKKWHFLSEDHYCSERVSKEEQDLKGEQDLDEKLDRIIELLEKLSNRSSLSNPLKKKL